MLTKRVSLVLTTLADVLSNHQYMPDINDAIGCFLGPAGMVYAIFFGFTYQSVTGKCDTLSRLVNEEASSALMVMRMALATPDTTVEAGVKLEIAKHCREAMLTILEDIFSDDVDQPHENLLPGMQAILPMLPGVQDQLSRAGLSKELTHLAVHNIERIHETVVATGPVIDMRRQVTRNKISVPEWAFLQILGFSAFFGIMLVDAASFRMNMVICFITVGTIATLMM